MATAVVVFSIVLGAGALLAYRNAGQSNRTVESWSKTKGTILKSTVSGSPNAILRVEYEYFVDGVRYTSKVIHPGLDYYRLGLPYDLKKVEFLQNPEVKYDPKNPADCCLLTYDKGWANYLILVFGIVMSLVGWIGLLKKIIN